MLKISTWNCCLVDIIEKPFISLEPVLITMISNYVSYWITKVSLLEVLFCENVLTLLNEWNNLSESEIISVGWLGFTSANNQIKTYSFTKNITCWKSLWHQNTFAEDKKITFWVMRKYIFLMMIFVATSAVDSTKIKMRRYLDIHDEGFVQNFWFSVTNYQS